jgi:hypothetical protein
MARPIETVPRFKDAAALGAIRYFKAACVAEGLHFMTVQPSPSNSRYQTSCPWKADPKMACQ